MISTRDLSGLPNCSDLKKLMQSLAVLDAIISPDWDDRYYSFDSLWLQFKSMGSMRNGEGDEYFCLFTPDGAIMKGFAHEAPMTSYNKTPPQVWPGIYESVPAVFSSAFLLEPAFSISDATFCIWWLNSEPGWKTGEIIFPPGDDPDGSAELLQLLDGNPATYCKWAEEYYGLDIEMPVVNQLYSHATLDENIVRLLNPDLSLAEIDAELKQIGYPRKE